MECHLCGREGKYQNKQGKWLCETLANKCPVVREKNSKRLRELHLEGKMRSGFSSQDRNKAIQAKKKFFSSLPFEQQAWKRQRNTVIAEQLNKCLECGLSHWMGKPVRLQIDHIDGNNQNNKRENLRALCPNCHSNTETFCGKNINTGSKKVQDEQILEEIQKGLTNRQILVKLGLTPKAGNYERVNKLRTSGETITMASYT